jgi:hypothetical protein
VEDSRGEKPVVSPWLRRDGIDGFLLTLADRKDF